MSSARLAAHVAVTRAALRATIATTPAARPRATKTHQPGALVVDQVTGQHGTVLHASTKHIHAPAPGQPAD